jgi:glycosyltransferase involved in cell wall biosynthesis
MTGRLDGAIKWGAYASAELFLLPSRQENFAITVAEAMHMGVPVVISNKVNTWPDVKRAGAGVVVDEERIERDLRDTIVMLLRNNELRRLMGEGGRRYARNNLTWGQSAARLLDCYDDVLASVRSVIGVGARS